MLESGDLLGLSFQVVGQVLRQIRKGPYHVDSGGSVDKSVVLDQVFKSVNTIINGSLGIVKKGPSSSSEHDSDQFGVIRVLLEDSDLFTSDFDDLARVAVSEFLWSWGSEVRDGNGSDALAESLEVPFACELEAHQFVFFQIVKSELVDTSGNDNNLDSSVSNGLDSLVEVGFFRSGEVEQILGVLNKDGSLGFSSLDFERTAVTSDLAVLGAEDGSKRRSFHDHTIDDLRVFQ